MSISVNRGCDSRIPPDRVRLVTRSALRCPTVDARAFLGLEATDDPRRWRLPVHPTLTTPGGFLFGGAGLAAGIEAMEAATGRPLVWASAQYLSYALPPSVVDLAVTVAVSGRQTAQARVVGRVGDQEIFTVNAALGVRGDTGGGAWARRPDVAPPDACPLRPPMGRHEGTITARIEVRPALVTSDAVDAGGGDGTWDGGGDGRSALWVRVPDLGVSAGTLAILGDWVPFGISRALGTRAGGNSLDNTIRILRLALTTWVLLDVRIQGVANGFGHGMVHLWGEDGGLLATASQSVMVRSGDRERATPPARVAAAQG